MELKNIVKGFLSSEESGQQGEKEFEMTEHTLAKIRMASHPEAKPWCLKKLSKHVHEDIVARVAENKNTEIEILEELVEHASPKVRVALAENMNTPLKVLLLLCADESADVRYRLAENHNAPLGVLAVLCEDENPYVCHRAMKTLSRLRQSGEASFVWLPVLSPGKSQAC